MRGPERRGLVPFFWMFVTLLSLPPAVVGLDIQDEMGRHEVGHIDNSMKIPLNNGVGCRFEGQFSINKVYRDLAWSPLTLFPIPVVLFLPGNWMVELCAHLPSPVSRALTSRGPASRHLTVPAENLEGWVLGSLRFGAPAGWFRKELLLSPTQKE